MNTIKKLQFSVFEPLNGKYGAEQTRVTGKLNFQGLIQYFKSPHNKKLSLAILNEKDKDKKIELKSQQTYFTASGTFSYRENASILHHNNLISIDIDDLSGVEEALKIKQKLADHKSTLFTTLSTRGKGVKALMLVNKTYKPEEQFEQLKKCFRPYLQDYLQLDNPDDQIDNAQFVLSQPFYFCYDADMYVNEDAEPLNLTFDYKEPERPKFKAVSIPTTANTKTDSYILKVLQNKLDLLTSDGARHPKLAHIKQLAVLNHYAPHLENEILETFISAGERMYSSNEKAKIRGVRKSVMDAWNKSINEPINNPTLEGFVSDQKALLKPKASILKNDYKHKLTTQYIGQDSEAMKLICNSVENNKVTSLSAGMGLGKTTMLIQLQKMLNKKIIISVPTIAIAQQQYNATILNSNVDASLIIGGIFGDKINEDSNIIYVTNASLNKLKNLEKKVIIIDEGHLSSDRSPINQNSNFSLYKVMAKSHSTLFMSGTPNDILEYSIAKDLKRIKIEPMNVQKFDVTTLVYDNKKTKQKDVIRKFASKKDGRIKFIFMNDKVLLNNCKDNLIKLKIYEKDEIVMYSANEEDVDHENYKTLMKDSLIPEGTKVVLATSKVAEGVSILNEEAFSFLYIGKEVNDFLQSFSRTRKAKSLKIFTLFEKSFLTKNGKIIDELECYNNLVEQVSGETISPELFMSEGVKKRERFSISDDFQGRSHFLMDGNNVLNPFEIAHEVKQIKESYYNLDLWKRDVLGKMPEITFLDPVLVNVDGDVEADLLDKERKLIKKEFLNKLKQTYHTAEILDLVLKQSKNDNLKGRIKKHLEGVIVEETLTADELILFRDKCFKPVSKWVANTFRLKRITKTNFKDTAKIIVKEDLFSAAIFNRVYERNICLFLEHENNPDKSKTEHQLFNRYLKTVELFKDINVISKNDLKQIFKTKLHYKRSQFNRSVIINKIGFVYDVLYCKKTRLYTLKKGNHILFSLIDNPTKSGTTQIVKNEVVNPQKIDFFPNGHQTGKSGKIDETPSELEPSISEKILSVNF